MFIICFISYKLHKAAITFACLPVCLPFFFLSLSFFQHCIVTLEARASNYILWFHSYNALIFCTPTVMHKKAMDNIYNVGWMTGWIKHLLHHCLALKN